MEELPLDPENRYFKDLSQDIGMSEAMIPADSSLVGRTIRDTRLRAESGLTAIGLRRASEAITGDFLDEKLRVGDTLLVTGFWKDIQRMQRDNRQLVLLDMPAEFEDVLPAAGKGKIALGILGLVVLMMITGVLPNVHAVLIGCLLMGMFGVMTMKGAYRLDQLEEPGAHRGHAAVFARPPAHRGHRHGGGWHTRSDRRGVAAARA